MVFCPCTFFVILPSNISSYGICPCTFSGILSGYHGCRYVLISSLRPWFRYRLLGDGLGDGFRHGLLYGLSMV